MQNFGKYLRGLKRRLFEKYYAVRFRLGETIQGEPPVADGAHVYLSLPFETMRAILRRTGLDSKDTLVDLGCGKGRLLLVGSLFHPATVIGIELSSRLAEIARRHAGRLIESRLIEVLNCNVLDYDFNRGTVFYLYNPFEGDILQGVMDRLESSLLNSPRPIRIIYVGPYYAEIIDQRPWLQRYDNYTLHSWGSTRIEVICWKSRDISVNDWASSSAIAKPAEYNHMSRSERSL